MDVKGQYLPLDKLRLAMNVLDPCMDDYLFILDLKTRWYEISESAAERFCIPSNEYYLTEEQLARQVFPKDLDLIIQDLREIAENRKTRHDLQYRWLGADGQPVWINCRGRVLADSDGQAEFLIGCINEIGRRQKADNVSGLIVAGGMQQVLDEHCAGGFFMRLDIDEFREINENHGLDYGDRVLRDTALCIESVLGPNQYLYHINGDEFAVLDLADTTKDEVHQLYRRIRKAIDNYISENGFAVFFTLSAGIVEIDRDRTPDYATLMTLSEFSLSVAKKRGKNIDYFYNADDFHASMHRKMLLHELRQAVLHDYRGFEAYFQPVEDIREGVLYGAETLLRFTCENGSPVSPVEFIPLLEESRLIIPVGRWILRRAMEFCKKMQIHRPNFKVSVNISYIQIIKSDLIRDVSTLLEEYDLAPQSIQMEMTESGFFETDQSYTSFCDNLKKLGIPLALDDFGTGYSNFHYLYHIDPQVIKIDRSFTLKALNYGYEFNLLRHMVQLTHSINSKMCIEGIETRDELERICELDPDFIQGYYFGKPYPESEFFSRYVHT